MTDFHFAVVSYSREKDTCPKSPHLWWGNFGHIFVLFQALWRSAVARIQNKLLTGTIIVIHSEKEVFVVKNNGNRKENVEKSSEVAPLDGVTVGIEELEFLCTEV